uniref:Ig-like domain-containing protein n=1 Tax=Megaselia scalaris TaxID=36166 RepID=T1GS67_MEGSC
MKSFFTGLAGGAGEDWLHGVTQSIHVQLQQTSFENTNSWLLLRSIAGILKSWKERTFSWIEPITKILGGPDLYIDAGSTVNLTCIIINLPESPELIRWTHNNEVRIFVNLIEISIPKL